MKRCTKCSEEKTLDQFYRSHGRPTAWCKACYDKSNRAWHERNSRTRNDYQVTYNRARRLGMTHAEYVALGGDPGRQCAICGATPDSPRNGHYRNGTETASKKRLAIDHCHTTGRLRGFLCSKCNHALGNADDSPDLLRKMADYLEQGAEITPLGSYKVRSAIARRDSGRGGPLTSKPATCSVEGCERLVRAQGLCGMHEARLVRHGTTDDLRIYICTVEGCERAARTKGLCPMHYKRLKRLGDPTTGWIPPEQAATHCATCNVELQSYRTTQRFCSVKCRNASYNFASAKEA